MTADRTRWKALALALLCLANLMVILDGYQAAFATAAMVAALGCALALALLRSRPERRAASQAAASST